MADIALLAPGVSDAPEGYQIPGAQEIIVKAVTANYDGTNAAGDFVPTLQVIAPNGSILASCPTSITVAAGGTADVSWFPRSGVASSSPGGGITEIESADGSVTISSPFGPTTDLSVNFPPPPVFGATIEVVSGGLTATAGSVTFVSFTGGGSLLDLTTPTNPLIIAAGVYLIGVVMSLQIGGTVTSQYIRWGFFTGATVGGVQVSGTTHPVAANKPSQSNLFYASNFSANEGIGVQVVNDDSQSHGVHLDMSVTLLA